MAERSVRVRLTAVVADFKRAMGEASSSVEGVSTAAKGAEKESGRLGQAGRAVGMGMVKAASAATIAVGALGIGALKTGVAYNTLEQSSQAALTTLLGSSQAAAEQMAKLREFGATSPFPRQVWIEAQQQLLAFGFAAEDIIPTFSAIQDAVAAAGGSSVDIQEIVRVLAQVQSTGKVSAETLNQLGVRGIDAATLVGDAMGKTAQQIRTDISSGALDAATFIETLTTSMTEKFGGAADGLKNTWVGAVDRIKGAFRDIGSAIAEPFIAKAGGGAAVQWANSVADIMRALEAQILGVITAMGPSFEGRFASLNDVLQRVAEAIRGIDMATLTSWAERLGPALGTAAGGLAAFATSARPIAALGLSINPLVGAFAGLVATSPELRGALMDLLSALTPLLGPIGQLSTILATAMAPAVSAVAGVITPLATAVGGLVSAFTSLPGPVQIIVAALGGMAALSGPLGDFNDLMSAIPERLSALPAKLGQLAGGVGGVKGALTGLLGVFGGPWGVVLGGATLALGAFATKNAEAKQEIESVRTTLDEQTGAVTESTEAWLAKKLIEDGIAEQYKGLGGNVDDLVGALIGEEDAIRRVDGVLNKHKETYSATVDGYATGGDAITVAGERLTGAAANVHEALFNTEGALKTATEEQKLFAEAMGETPGKASEVQVALDSGATVAIEGYGEVVDGAMWSTKDLTAAMDELIVKAFGQEEAADKNAGAILRWKEEMDRAREAGDGLSFALEGNTLEAIDNRSKIRDLVGGVQDMIVADLEAGLTKDEAKEKARQYKKQLEDELVQMGFNREEVRKYTGRVDGMVESIEEIPDRAGVDVYVTGDGVAIEKIKGLEGVIKGLQNKTIVLTAKGISSTDPKFGIRAEAQGGYISGPGSGTSDSIPALLSNGEYVVKAASVSKYGTNMLDMVNAGRFATGGQVGRELQVKADASQYPGAGYWQSHVNKLMLHEVGAFWKQLGGNGLAWARSQAGKPYIWGGVGPHGYDCSGFMSAITNVLQGRNPHSRRFATGSFPTGDFARGYGRFSIGSFRGNPGHMAGTLGGVNVESRGGEGVVVGPRARGASNPLFGGNVWHLRGYAQGGLVGDPPFDMNDPRGKHFGLGIFDRGGRLMPGQAGVNLSGAPETVLSPQQSETFDRLVSQLEGMRATAPARLASADRSYHAGDTHLTVVSPMDEQVAVIDRRLAYRDRVRRMPRR